MNKKKLKKEANIKNDNIVQIPIFKQIIICVVGIFLFKSIGKLFNLLFSFLFKNFASQNSVGFSCLINVSVYLFLLIFLFLIVGLKDIKELFKSFKKPKTLFGLLASPVTSVLNIIYIFILLIFGITLTQTNNNQNTFVELLNESPIIIAIITCLIGPFCEEIIYRVGLYSLLRRVNKYFALIVSALVFAFAHFDFKLLFDVVIKNSGETEALVNEFLNLPPYIFYGLFFGFIYEKCGFSASLIGHCSVNIIAVISNLIRSFIEKLFPMFE